MTDNQIKQLIADEVAKQLAAMNATPDSTDEVLECIMFTSPKQWGRRVIKRENEILLQMTSDEGHTWQDAPIPDVKLILPETKMRAMSDNPYAGLIIEDTTPKTRSAENGDHREIKPEILNSISSGALLSKTEDEEGLEGITFLGTFSTWGSTVGQIYQDNKGYLRIAQ